MLVEYKDIEEQIDLIKAKNILIKDEEKAKEILLRESYYNLITGYKDIFIDIKNSKQKGKETCNTETYFEEIYAVYKFDRELRNMMLDYISIIETNVKSYITNIFSQKYGAYNYLKKENFYITEFNENKFNDFVQKIEYSIDRNIDNYDNIKLYKQEYNVIPLWMATTLMTFGNIINFYSLMKTEDKKKVASIFSIQHKDMLTFLKMLNIVRNISAHGNPLFNIRLDIKYPAKSDYYHSFLNIRKKGNTYENGIDDILAIIIILERFLEADDYKRFINEFKLAVENVKKELDDESFENFLEKMGVENNIWKKMCL